MRSRRSSRWKGLSSATKDSSPSIMRTSSGIIWRWSTVTSSIDAPVAAMRSSCPAICFSSRAL